jgi:putative ABC transport system permease protein
MQNQPPRFASALLKFVLSDDDFESIGGDLEEFYVTDILPARSRLAAQLWYCRQVASVIAAHAFNGSDRVNDRSERTSMATFRQDLSYAWRALSRQPGFTVVALVTLALGIGANVAMFSLVNAVLFKRLPFSDPDRLVAVHLLSPAREPAGRYRPMIWSYPKYQFFKNEQQIFDSTAIFWDTEWSVTGSGSPERVAGEFVDAGYLTTLGILPSLGRGFTGEETTAPGSTPLVILSHGLWQRRFGGDPDVLGQTLGLNGIPHTIVGVLPAAFHGLSGRAEMLVPVTTQSAGDLGEAWNHSYRQVARVKQEVTLAEAEAAVRLLGDRVHAAFPARAGHVDDPRDRWTATAIPLNDERVDPLIRRSVLVMLAVVGAVLLIVCVNLANLMLVRALARQREIGIRLALGASRARILRQLMTESLLLSGGGALAGLAVAYGTILGGSALLPDLRMVLPPPTAGLTRVGLGMLGLDGTTLLFTIAVTAATAVLFGLGPAWRAARRDLTVTIRAGSSGSLSQGTSRVGVRPVLIVAEMALALVLLAAGGLMLKSAARLQATELGFQPDSLLTVRLALPAPKYDGPRSGRLLGELIERLKQQPGIESVGYGSCAPVSGPCNGTTATFPGRPPAAPGTSPSVFVLWASPTLFDTLGVRLERGRVFTDHDRTGQPKVVVINETAARTFFGPEDPIGKRIGVGQGGFGDGAEIVGIVADVRYGTVENAIRPAVYLPLLQSPRTWGVIFVRAKGTPAQLVPAVRAELKALDPDLPLIDAKTMEQRFDDATWRTRASAWLLGVFAALALTLAAVGIYGVMSQTVAQRSQEIGVRLALGAERSDILRLILGRALIFSTAGVLAGLALAIPSMRGLSALLYQVTPGDPIVLLSLAAGLLFVALVASYVPAVRATRVDPLTTLRSE